MGGFPNLGVPFWGPHNKDYNILGSILGFPYFGKLPYTCAKYTLKPGSDELGPDGAGESIGLRPNPSHSLLGHTEVSQHPY